MAGLSVVTTQELYRQNSHSGRNQEKVEFKGETIEQSCSSTSMSSNNSSIHSVSPKILNQHEYDRANGFQTPTKAMSNNELKEQVQTPPVDGVQVELLRNLDYIHGGYAGAAPHLLKDEKWMLLLQYLMPDEHRNLTNYVELVCAGSSPDPLKVMKWGENNPIVAAYGVLNSKRCEPAVVEDEFKSPPISQGRDNLLDLANVKRSALAQLAKNTKRSKRTQRKREAKFPALEWDVFVDPTIVRSVHIAIQAMEDLMHVKDREVYEEEVIAANIEVDRQVARLANRMMLAHGSATQLLVEAVGVAARYNFSKIMNSGKKLQKEIKKGAERKRARGLFGYGAFDQETPQTSFDDGISPTSSIEQESGSGLEAMDVKTCSMLVDRWLALFSSALRLGKTETLKSMRFLVEKGKIRKDRLNKTRSFTARTSQLLRSTLSKSFDDDGSSGYIIPETEDEYQNPSLCGLFLCLGMNDPHIVNADHGNSNIAESAQIIKKILGENLRLVLDMKSRHVPAKVWGRLIGHLRSRNLTVEAIGSFDIDELRQIGKSTSFPVTTIFFFHSAGDLQRAIHANEIKRGDTVYFNAGSLFQRARTVCDYHTCWSASKIPPLQQVCSDVDYEFELLSFQPYAYPKDAFESHEDLKECKATLADYQEYFDLNIGLYVQEFSIGSEELDALVKLVNKYPKIYRCGLAWGGLNGIALKGVQGDGFWSQRYVGRNWTFNVAPEKNMTLIAVEDHHAVQKAIMYGACGQVTTVNHIMDEEQNLICENPNVVGFTQTGNLNML